MNLVVILCVKVYQDIGKESSTELDIDSVQFRFDGGVHPAKVMGVPLLRSIVVLDNLDNKQ